MLAVMFFLIILSGLGLFLYHNIYLTVIAPPPLDTTLTERKTTRILTEEYNTLVKNEAEWQSIPSPTNLSDIFHR